MIANIRGKEVVQGGSTITQQYVKNAYVGTERTLERKVKEAVLARQINRLVDKDEILFRYLDGVYLGERASGVGAASRTYFRKPVNELSLSEAALLAGLIPAPSRYEPRGNPDAAEARRVLVLDAMLEQDYITADEHAEARRLRLWLTAGGPAPRPSTLVYPPTDPTDNEYPEDFPDRIIDYVEVEEEIFKYIQAFRIAEVTLDQYSSTQSIQQLNRRVQQAGFSWHPHIHERTATALSTSRLRRSSRPR